MAVEVFSTSRDGRASWIEVFIFLCWAHQSQRRRRRDFANCGAFLGRAHQAGGSEETGLRTSLRVFWDLRRILLCKEYRSREVYCE